MAPKRQLSRDHITYDLVTRLFRYDPLTGMFTRLVQRQRHKVGDRAGYYTSGGYRSIKIGNVVVPESVLAWFMMTGEWPEAFVDHRNLVRDDNRWDNLREATPSQNRANTNKYGLDRGIVERKYVNGTSVWRVGITVNGVRENIGTFTSLAAAREAYTIRAKVLHGEFFCNP